MPEEEKVENNLAFNLASFGKTKRLLTKKDFSAVFSNKTKVHSKYFYAFIAIKNPNKIGIVVAKKNHKLAVKRNRVKRLVREFFRLNYHLFDGVQLVIFAKKFDNYNQIIINQDLGHLLDKINEISKKSGNPTN